MVAGSPGRRGDKTTLKSTPDTALLRPYLLDRLPVAVAAVAHQALPAAAQIGERVEMGVDQIGHLDVVADDVPSRVG